jgi:small subunit ribosomal protein S17
MADETPETEQTDPSDAATADAPPALSGREERARREHAAKSQRPSRTPEQRDAERRELRASKAVARRRRRQQEKTKRAGAARATGTPPAEPKVATPQVRTGTVVSAKPDKTIVVRIDIARRHRRYEKIVRSTSKLHVHDEANDAHEGDRVRVVESRPLSRTKRWKLVEVLERAR